MIVCPWKDLKRYEAVIPGLEEAMKAVEALENFEPATYPLSGSNKILVQKVTTKAWETSELEAHREFLDIQYILKGKEMLVQYAKAKGLKLSTYTKTQYMEAVMHKYGFRDWESLLAAIGHGGLKEGQIFNKLLEAYDKENKKNMTDEQVLEAVSEAQDKVKLAKSKSGIVVKGIHDVAVRFSKCCSPIPGDEIVGFVTRGRGITIHRTDCVNVVTMSEMDRSRLIEAEWQQPDKKAAEKYLAEISVYSNNRTGLLVDISKLLTERKVDVRSINSRISKQEKATISLSFEVESKEELQYLIDKLRQIESVIDVERSKG